MRLVWLWGKTTIFPHMLISILFSIFPFVADTGGTIDDDHNDFKQTNSKKSAPSWPTGRHLAIDGKNSDENYPDNCLPFASTYSASMPVPHEMVSQQHLGNNVNRNYQENDGTNIDNIANDHTTNNNKRIRTSFKKFQLDLLRQYFKRTHKPNLTEMNILVNRTNLSRRVLQVLKIWINLYLSGNLLLKQKIFPPSPKQIWFQNQRSKWSRYILARPIYGPEKVRPFGTPAQLFAIYPSAIHNYYYQSNYY